jgi:hypothetical protein
MVPSKGYVVFIGCWIMLGIVAGLYLLRREARVAFQIRIFAKPAGGDHRMVTLFHLTLLWTLWTPIQPAPGDSILHIWETREKDGRIQVLRSGDTY